MKDEDIRQLFVQAQVPAEPVKMQETIAVCKRIVREQSGRMMARSGFWAFLAEIFRREGAYLAGGQAGMLLLVCILIRNFSDIPGMIPVCIPFFWLASFPSLFAAGYCGMDEIEAVTRNANIQLILAKLIIVTASDLFDLTLLLAVAYAAIGESGSLPRLILYVLVPYIFCLTMLLYLLRHSGKSGYRSCIWTTVLCSGFLGGAAVWLPGLYLVSAFGLWLLVLAIFTVFLMHEIYASVKEMKEGRIYGVIA